MSNAADHEKHFDVPDDKRKRVDAIKTALIGDYRNLTAYAAHAVEGAGGFSFIFKSDGTAEYVFEKYTVYPRSLKLATMHAENVMNALKDLQELLGVKHDEWNGNGPKQGG